MGGAYRDKGIPRFMRGDIWKMQKKNQYEILDSMMKRPIPKKKVGIVHLEMVKEGRSLYGMDRMNTAQVAAEMVRPILERANREMFLVIALDAKLTPMALEIVAVGSLNVNYIQMKDVYQLAILNNCSYLMCIHNHPSGDPEPSPEDIIMTGKISKSGILLGVELVDPIILGEAGKYYSFREKNGLPELSNRSIL